eukprot:4752722-Prorocentrum_lima.AAC.1
MEQLGRRLKNPEEQGPPAPPIENSVPYLSMVTGNVLVDAFKPWYLGVAFPFLFKYCTAMPDVTETRTNTCGRWRRTKPGSLTPPRPRVDLEEWGRTMMRRVEGQFRGDWTFGY